MTHLILHRTRSRLMTLPRQYRWRPTLPLKPTLPLGDAIRGSEPELEFTITDPPKAPISPPTEASSTATLQDATLTVAARRVIRLRLDIETLLVALTNAK